MQHLENPPSSESIRESNRVHVCFTTSSSEITSLWCKCGRHQRSHLEDTVIKPGAVVTDCIIYAGSEIGPLNSIEEGQTDVRVDDELFTDIKFGGLIGDNVQLNGNVTIEPGTFVGNRATVESGSTLTG